MTKDDIFWVNKAFLQLNLIADDVYPGTQEPRCPHINVILNNLYEILNKYEQD